MDKVWDHKAFEENIYKLWEESSAFTPQKTKDKPPFTIIMPPPNANDPLHIGHARFVAIEDILVRYHRMKGEPTLWLPGSDHAGIETQYVFEKKLKAEGKSRFDYDRDTLYQMIWNYVQENKAGMESQLRTLGASCDWTRNIFTLDPNIIKIVYQTFKKLNDNGLIYRGKRLVNYCTYCGTAFSGLEVVHIERKDPLYYIKYGPFTLATVRPETKFGDTAVAVHPDDKRYRKYIGKVITVKGLIGDFQVKVIADKAVDPNFGTGVVKITPAHDFNDFEMGERHGLEIKQVIGLDGKLNNLAGKYAGLYINQARKRVVEDLEKAGLLVKTDNNYTHIVGTCYRCKNVIEPMLLEQWFLKVEPLTKLAINSIKKSEVKFAAKKFEKIAIHWLKNLKDWNISRQIVWGIKIPAWKCTKCDNWVITKGDIPKNCDKCGGKNLVQDSDTFDTWFSSSQWPFATLLTKSKISSFQFPTSKNKKAKVTDFDYFYPTSVMETAYDILPFWVIRMIMMGLYVTGKVPFKEVVIHGLVRDREGQKISKSKGNVIDPILMTQKYGSDALRMSLIWGTLVENDISLSEDNIRGQRNFSNKIWNIARFVEQKSQSTANSTKHIETQNEDDKWILEELKKTINKATKALDIYKLNEAAEELYDFVWHKFADVYIEKVKTRKNEALPILRLVLRLILIMLHPFMPFVSEKIYQLGFAKTQKDLLINASWPV